MKPDCFDAVFHLDWLILDREEISVLTDFRHDHILHRHLDDALIYVIMLPSRYENRSKQMAY